MIGRITGYSLVEAKALHELGVRNHGWYMTEAEHRGVLDVLVRQEAENQRLRETPRAIYVKVSTALLADLTEWSDPMRVKIERQDDDTYEMTFKREALAGDAE